MAANYLQDFADDEELIGAEKMIGLMYAGGAIDDDEALMLLSELERPVVERKAPDYQHRNYASFDLDRLTEDECWARFRLGQISL